MTASRVNGRMADRLVRPVEQMGSPARKLSHRVPFSVSRATFFWRGLALSLLLGGSAAVAGAKAPEAPLGERERMRAAMEAVTLQDHSRAEDLLQDWQPTTPALKRERAFTLAVAKLAAMHVTDAQLREVEQLLRAVIEEKRDDDLGLAARFHLARLFEGHVRPLRISDAQALYQELWAQHPASWFGQYAVLRLSIIDLYPTRGTTRPTLPQIEAWERRLEAIQDPVLLRNFYWTLGDAHLRIGSPPQRALALYRRGEALGFTRDDIRDLMLLRIHNLALEVGDRALALEYAQRLIVEQPRSAAVTLMRERVAVLSDPLAPLPQPPAIP